MSNTLRGIAPKFIRGMGYRLRFMMCFRQLVPAQQYRNRKLDIYWLSTGRCGTRFLYHLLNTADNVAAFHDLGMLRASRDRAVRLYLRDREAYWNMPLDRFMRDKVREAGKYPAEVYIH